MQSLIVLHHNAGPARNGCIQTHRVLYNAIVLHPVCALALPTYNALISIGIEQLTIFQEQVRKEIASIVSYLSLNR